MTNTVLAMLPDLLVIPDQRKAWKAKDTMRTRDSIGDSETLPLDQIISVLTGAELEQAWKFCLSDWEGSSPAQRADCRSFIVNLRDHFLRILRDVDDPREQETVAALFYIQVKAQWILINTQSGYQIQRGTVDGALFCRSGMISAMLGAMEPVLRPVDLTRITDFLAGPQELEDEVAGSDRKRIEALLGADVFPAPLIADGSASGLVVVNARSLEKRLRELITKQNETEHEWQELKSDLGVSSREEIVALFNKVHRARQFDSSSMATEDALAEAAHIEWVERRELQLRALRKEVGALRTHWEQIAAETGATDATHLVAAWRETKDALIAIRAELAQELDHLSVLRTEYGTDVSATRIVAERRTLSSQLAQQQAHHEMRRAENEFLEREFGTSHPEQIVTLVRNLRDQIGTLSTQSRSHSDGDANLTQEIGTADATTIIVRFRELRDTLASSSKEMIALRADRYIFQDELGKTDAREIVAYIRNLETQIKSFQEMSELLGTMEQALKTLNS